MAMKDSLNMDALAKQVESVIVDEVTKGFSQARKEIEARAAKETINIDGINVKADGIYKETVDALEKQKVNIEKAIKKVNKELSSIQPVTPQASKLQQRYKTVDVSLSKEETKAIQESVSALQRKANEEDKSYKNRQQQLEKQLTQITKLQKFESALAPQVKAFAITDDTSVEQLREYVKMANDLVSIRKKLGDSKAQLDFDPGKRLSQLNQNMTSWTSKVAGDNGLKRIAEEEAKAVADLKGRISGSGVFNISEEIKEDVSSIDLMTQALNELGEEYKNVSKYAVDAETAFSKLKELEKKRKRDYGLNPDDMKDYVGYGSRLAAIDTDYQYELTPDMTDWMAQYTKKYREMSTQIYDITMDQIDAFERLSNAAKESGNSDGTKSSKNIEELRQEIESAKADITSLMSRVDALEDADGFEKLQGQVQELDRMLKMLSDVTMTNVQKAVIQMYDGINNVFEQNNGNKISGYWDVLKSQIEGSGSELERLVKLVGLWNSEQNGLKVVNDGMVKSGGFIGDDITVLASKNKNGGFAETQELKKKLDEAYESGVNVARILDIIGNEESKVFLEIQETAKGDILGSVYGQNDNPFVNPEIFEATDAQIKKLIEDLITLNKLGIGVDINASNIFYDKLKGFQFIDLDLSPTKYKNAEEFKEDMFGGILGGIEEFYEDANDKLGQDKTAQLRQRFEQLSDIVQSAYADAQDSHSSSKAFEKLEGDAVDGVVVGEAQNEDKLKNVGRKMAEAVKDGYKEEMSDGFESPISSGQNANENAVSKPENVEDIKAKEVATTALTEAKEKLIQTEKEEKGASQDDSQVPELTAEEQAMAKLQEALLATTLAVRNKNSAFEDEAQIVASAVGLELGKLEELYNALVKVGVAVKELSDIPVKIDINAESIKDFDPSKFEALSNLKEKLTGINTDDIKALAESLNAFNKETLGDNLTAIASGILDLRESLDGFNNGNALSGLSELLSKTDELKSLATILSSSRKEIKEAIKLADEAKASKSNNSKVSDEEASKIAEQKQSIKGLESAISKFGKLDSSKYTQEAVDAIDRAQIGLQKCQEIIDKIEQGEIVDDKDLKKVEELKTDLEAAFRATKSSGGQLASTTAITNLVAKMQTYLNNNSGMSSAFRKEIESLIESLSKGEKISKEFANTTATAFNQTRGAVAKAGQETKSFFDMFTSRVKGMSASALAQYFSLYDIIRYGKEMANTVREYDTALTEMRKVSDESIQGLKDYQQESFNVGNSVGTTGKQIQQSTADWLRLGEAFDEAKESAKDATILLDVSEFENIDAATQSLVSASQAFKDLDKMEIIDVLNNIGNNFSVSTDKLAEGLQNAAAVLQTQGNDLNQSVALLTAGNAITQDMSKTSAGIRTISLRISGTEEAKDELASIGEDVDDFVVQTRSKTEQIIKDYTAVASNQHKGISVLDDNGNLRDTYDIMLDIAKVYKEIQEEDKKAGTNRANALVEALAGKNRSNIAASILQNPEMLEDVYKAAQNSEGSAQQELDKYLDSIDGKISQFQNKIQDIQTSLVSDEAVKTAIELGTDLLSLIDGIVDHAGSIPSILTAIAGGLSAVQNVGKTFKFSYI